MSERTHPPLTTQTYSCVQLVNAYNLIVAAGGLVSCAHAGRRPHEEN